MEEYPRNLTEFEALFATEEACREYLHQGAVSHKHLDYYLDEFTFRVNRRKSKRRGSLLFRLAAAGGGCRASDVRRNRSADPSDSPKSKPTSCRAYLSEAHTHLPVLAATAQP